jgi:hypothetical protein
MTSAPEIRFRLSVAAGLKACSTLNPIRFRVGGAAGEIDNMPSRL